MNNLKLMDLSTNTHKTVQKGFTDTYASSYSSGDQDDLNDFSEDNYLKPHNLYDHEEEIDDYQLEEDYIMKLKTQRERIEKLEKASNQKDQLLLKEVQRSKQLLEEVDRLSSYVPFKQKYDSVFMEKEELEREFDKMYNELKDVKQELSDVVKEGTARTDKLKRQINEMTMRNREILHDAQEKLSDKNDQIKNLKNMLKNVDMQHQKELKSLKVDQEKLLSKLEETIFTLEKQCGKYKQDIKNRDEIIDELEKMNESIKKTNLEFKTYMQKYSEEVEDKEKELYQQLNKTKHNLALSKKTVQELKTEIHEHQLAVKKAQEEREETCNLYEELKSDFRKANEIFESTLKKKEYEFVQELKHANLFIDELKSSIEQLMEVKNSLLAENRKQMAIIKRKQEIQRQRKQILRTQFKQINRIEKVIDRLE